MVHDTGAREGRNGLTCGPMSSCEQAVVGLESRAVSAPVTKHFVTIFSKTWTQEINFLSI